MTDKKKNIRGEEALMQLMEHHAQQDGQCLWQEFEAACDAGNNPTVSDSLDRACKFRIREHFSEKTWRERHPKIFSTIFRWAACVVLLLAMVMTTVLKTDADSNIHVDRYLEKACSLSELKTRYIIHVRLFPGSENQDVEGIAKVMSGLTAKGYHKTREYVNHSATADRPAAGLYSCYENAQGQTVILNSRVPMSGIIIVYKQEGLYATQVEHLGYKMVLVEHGSSRQLYWLDDAEGLCYSLYTDGLSESEFWDLVYGLAQE